MVIMSYHAFNVINNMNMDSIDDRDQAKNYVLMYACLFFNYLRLVYTAIVSKNQTVSIYQAKKQSAYFEGILDNTLNIFKNRGIVIANQAP